MTGPAPPGGRTDIALAGRDVSQRGSVTLELAILAPALLLLVGLVIAAGRISLSAGAIEAAAYDAARQASIARNPVAAAATARAAATDTLAQQGLRCAPLTVTVDTAGFAKPVGVPAEVAVRVSCVVSLGDMGVPGMPGHKTLRAHFLSPLDQYRER